MRPRHPDDRVALPMISYDEALARLIGAVQSLPGEAIGLDAAGGRTLAKRVVAAIDAPRADVSAMDGYAVRMTEARAGDWLNLVGEAAAGAPFGGDMSSGEAVRIFTGAYVPTGADCVVMQEYAEREGDRVRFREGFGPARHIRKRAGDFAKGATLLEVGQRLTPRAMVALAGADIAGIEVTRRAKVAVIATGDELEQPGSAHLSPHGLPESGSYGVGALAMSCGATLAERMRGRDDLDVLSGLARRALDIADCVVVIGGASVGDHDLARPMFAGIGLHEHFARIAIKPGKPVWFGMCGGKPVLGLPGNPTSAMVTARLFLVPLLAAMQGGNGADEVRFMPQILAADLPPNGSREAFVRARATEEGLLPADNQESGAQAPLASSDWLIRRPANYGPCSAGEVVRAIRF